MKLHLFGASGSGVTTLGKHLAGEFGYPYFDTDDYFWLRSDPPFQLRQVSEARNALLMRDLEMHGNWLLGGSVINWGSHWITAFDLAIFSWTPLALRVERLKKRELESYGTVILDNPERKRQYENFIAWASDYDFGNSDTGRTRAAHEAWMAKIRCPILRLEGDATVEERVKASLEFVRKQRA